MTITQQQAVKICPVNDAACGELPPSVRCAECKQSTAQPQAVVPAPTYVDSTPHLHVGESSFEGWYQAHPKACTGDKQLARDAYAAGMGDPLVTAAQPSAQAERAPVQAVQATSERTPQDYAIEHAEYMAVDGERLIAAINDFGKALQEVDDGTANPSDVDAARETLTEALGALRSGIYEFRKRAARAKE